MSDLELPDLGGGHDLIGIDLEKGIYLVTKIIFKNNSLFILKAVFLKLFEFGA